MLQPPLAGARLLVGKFAGDQFADHVADRLIPLDRAQLQPLVQPHRQIDDQPLRGLRWPG
jgi:hypothetical protein